MSEKTTKIVLALLVSGQTLFHILYNRRIPGQVDMTGCEEAKKDQLKAAVFIEEHDRFASFACEVATSSEDQGSRLVELCTDRSRSIQDLQGSCPDLCVEIDALGIILHTERAVEVVYATVFLGGKIFVPGDDLHQAAMDALASRLGGHEALQRVIIKEETT